MERREMPDRSRYPTRLLRSGDREAIDDDLSAITTAVGRLEMVEILTRRCWTMRGQPVDGTGLQRHVARIFRRGG